MIWPDNFLKFRELRKEFPVLSYDAYDYHFTGNSLELSFSFSLPGKYSFHPQVSIPYIDELFIPFKNLSAGKLDNLVFHAGMIELISYWKAACPPEVIIKPRGLSSGQVSFWKRIYFNGLGEFFYLNSIKVNEDDFMRITYGDESLPAAFPFDPADGSLIPVGGGKDSAVTMGLLNRAGVNWLPFAINPGHTTREVIRAAGKDNRKIVEFNRKIHPQLLELNKMGFLNGHTPFSALLAFYSLLAAFLTGRGEIILSNEASASEPTVPGTSINHQYSKSIGFEKDFRVYARSFISPGFNYFSLLRPLSELQIARLFSEMPEFFHHFKSCNVGSKTGTWCGTCPKCLFTFIILSPFIKPSVLTEIFGKNLLDDPALKDTFEQLSGRQEIKPFDCIGTVDEVNAALDRAAEMYGEGSLPCLLQLHQHDRRSQSTSQNDLKKMLTNTDQDHFVPEKYFNLLAKELR